MNRNHRNRNHRLRVAVNRLALSFLFLIAAAVLTVRADDPPKKLAIVDTAHYSTAVVVSAKSDATEPVSFSLSDCATAGYPVTLEPHGATIIRDLADYLCKPGFALVDSPTNADATSVLSFDDGQTRTSLSLGPLGAVTWDRKTKILGPLVNDPDGGAAPTFRAWITTFAKAETPMHVNVYDGAHLFTPKHENFTAAPPVSQYQLQTRGVVFLEIGIGDSFWQCFPSTDCSFYQPVYGFASWGDPLGGNFVAFPFEPAVPPAAAAEARRK